MIFETPPIPRGDERAQLKELRPYFMRLTEQIKRRFDEIELKLVELSKTQPSSAPAVSASKLSPLTMYPVGSIYMSVNETSPETIFGGEWERIKDRFLLSAGDTYSAGATGGEAEHTLTVKEMPSHSHAFDTKHSSSLASNSWIPHQTANSGTVQTNSAGDLIKKTGGDQPHNNMPPYLTVYMWKRTA